MDDKLFVNIELSDVLTGIIKSHKEGNEKLNKELKNIYFKATTETMNFPKNLSFVTYLNEIKEEQKNIYIDENILLNALGIAKAKYNYDMERKLNSYYRAYMDAIRDGKSEIDVIVKILADKELVAFIKENNNLKDYIKSIQSRKKKSKVKVIGSPEVA